MSFRSFKKKKMLITFLKSVCMHACLCVCVCACARARVRARVCMHVYLCPLNKVPVSFKALTEILACVVTGGSSGAYVCQMPLSR